MKSSLRVFALASGLAALCLISVDVSAATARVKCETRAHRNRASIDGSGLAAGTFRARLISGAHRATSPKPGETSVRGEAEFDFDSAPNDIADGATEIGTDFIVQNQVVGKIYNAAGKVVAQGSTECRRR